MGDPISTDDSSAFSGGVSGVSTASSGPAGAHFEGQVAAFYLLAMLSGAPPRGLPGTTTERVALQQANAGFPLDDVIIHALDASGSAATLEIQVKRTITFAASDAVFRKVVGQIVATSRRPGFWSQRVEMAIATSRGSRKIDGPYQDVLALARQTGDGHTFAAQIKLAGAANDDMRTLVKTFQSHLKDEGAPYDDVTIWQLLRRLQILTFDFAAPGSVSKELARERVVRTLHADDAARADALWGNLIELAINVGKNGGDRTRGTLLESLVPLGFRFVGDRRHAKARVALAEDARLALADIGNKVGKVVLTRHERVAAVHEAFDRGHYVEIRGDAGVGKSGVLRQIAESLQNEAQIMVLSPGRCVPRGWSAMRAQLDFEGTLRDLLVELANDGGVVVFLDNLDSFNEEERRTVIDIIREAARVPGVAVLATARPDFGVDEPSWLPSDALDQLTRAEPVAIDELSKAEIGQLIASEPALAPLLSDNHPARQVTRNLFRLARLASRPLTEPLPRTEIDMAEQWWSTADGKRDSGWRDRSRLLHDMARQALSHRDALDVRSLAASPIDALVDSGTLRNLGADQVAFRHDVLCEWAIANALRADISLIDTLNLERPASATLARGVELAARMAIERDTDGTAWHALLERLSRGSAHKSWRRAVLLALVRSEAAGAILLRAQTVLLGDHARLLRELVRTVLAVEVVPASKVFAAAGIDPALIPAGLNVPRGRVWVDLVLWLLSLGNAIPGKAIPEVVDLYTGFSAGTLGATAITPLITRQLYVWLRQMEPLNTPTNPDAGSISGGQFEPGQAQSLRDDLRMGFVMFARTTPELAAEYLQAVAQTEHNERLVRSILKIHGSLAQAAPTDLAKLTAQALISKQRRRDRYSGREREEPFTFLDHEFLPASPAQGPFLELLVNSAQDGLMLVRNLVSHAVAHGSRGRDAGTDVINIALPDGLRTFPWTQTYLWSRNGRSNCVTSALMALEAWAHLRLDAGEPFESVLTDVLGPPGSCAAYLLVATDLIISHWPKSAGVAAAFLSCPELLCLDHTRLVHDQIGTSDFLAMGGSGAEPRGRASAAELQQKVSRRNSLDSLIGNYALTVIPDQLTKLTLLLRGAAQRLGPAGPQANLGDPEFMVLHALNLADPSNWHEGEVTLADGSTVRGRQYVSPDAEQRHLVVLRGAAEEECSDFAMQTAISMAIDNPSRLSLEQRLTAVAWASRVVPKASEQTGDDSEDASHRARQEAVLVAAMMVMRDGDDSLRAEYGAWARDQLEQAFKSGDDDPVLQIRSGLRFNPIAIAYVGLIHALRHSNSPDHVRALLEVAACPRHAAAHGLGAAVTVLESADERLLRALLRCALHSCVVPDRRWDLSDEEIAALAARRNASAKSTVDAEMKWLAGVESEPAWPAFPPERVRPRYGIRLRDEHLEEDDDKAVPDRDEISHEEHVNHQAAALWLRQVRGIGNANSHRWLRDIARAYMPWTIRANGGELDRGEEAENEPSDWNNVFFDLVARCVVGLTFAEADDLIVKPITGLPDRNFFDVLADFLRSLDAVSFGGDDLQESVAVGVRSALADRMMASSGWRRLSGKMDASIEIHIGPAIATLFFNDHHFVQSTKCYLHEKGIDRVASYFPVLDLLVQSAPSPFVALVLLNLLGVSPRTDQLGLLVRAAKVWLGAYPDSRSFWNDHGFGKRWCQIAERIYAVDAQSFAGNAAVHADIESIVAEMISLGVPEASRLEVFLSGGQR
ncbi:ATP-binding protein [Paraburkholderia sprentiae WSM5005]|uniref:ATP-binding protein n=1 Tax=Paraburkholderia sprentiae WSM5005 TaxID=754502 RepID=A0A1I9YRZ7_9BURK|nr:ATP-binding protein [Paraburkholderia sprentiae WSM5005]